MTKVSSRGGPRKAALFTEINDKLWWDYRTYSPEELTSIDNYLQQDAPKEIQLTTDIYENLKTIYKALGLHFHPFINYPLKKTIAPEVLENLKQQIALAEANNAKKGAVPMEKPEIPECEVLQINNIKVDPVVLKLLAYCWGSSKLSSLKLIRNQFETKVEEAVIDTLSNPSFKINKLFIDWNPPLNFELYPKLLNNTNIQFLSLRSNNLGDASMQILVNALKDNISLKSLDLYGNLITGAGVNQLKALIETSSGLEYVGLAKNHLGSWDDVREWLEGFGKFPITNEEVEAYRLKEKEKEVIVQKNLKNKGKKGYVDEPVPFLHPITQIGEAWFMTKGAKMKMISFALNQFDAECLLHFDSFLSNQDDDFHLILTGNPINKQDIEVYKQKHQTKLLF